MHQYPIKLRASEVIVGDLVDLDGEQSEEGEFSRVTSVKRESEYRVVINFDGFAPIAFPPDHLVTIEGHEEMAES